MKDIEEKLEMFRLEDQSVKAVLHTLDLVKEGQSSPAAYTVETIVVVDGKRKVVAKESRSV